MTITTNGLKIIYGGAGFSTAYGSTPESVEEVLQFLRKEGFTSIDSSQGYGDSETLLGKAKASSLGFEIDTKVAGGLWPHITHTKDVVIKAGEASIQALGVDQVDVYYIHAPDNKVPIKEILEGINELYKAGKFKRFGLSNFNVKEVEEVLRVAKENSFVLPTVYEGNYNAIGREVEKELFPLLREHGIAFYAYSPIAGGFLTKTPQDIIDGKGRFNKDLGFLGKLYLGLYNSPAKLEFLAGFGKIASDAGISQAELAHRWVVYHSSLEAQRGDGIIIGSRYGAQLESTLAWLRKGPLSADIAERVDGLSKIIEGEGILDNWHGYISKNLDEIEEHMNK